MDEVNLCCDTMPRRGILSFAGQGGGGIGLKRGVRGIESKGMSKERVSTGGGEGLGVNAFGGLNLGNLPAGPAKVEPQAKAEAPKKNRGRVDIVRSTAGRGGKTVTVVSGFTGIGLPEKEALAKQIQRAAGTGGTVKDGKIEIQGDKRDVAAKVLAEAGFRPVMAGG